MNFELNLKEVKRVKAFKKRQDKLLGNRARGPYIHSSYTYSFTPVGIGTVVEVENNTTKVTADITDYETW